jgi:hypothetical protein
MAVTKFVWEMKDGSDGGTMYTSGSVMFTEGEKLEIEKEVIDQRKEKGLYTEGQIPKDDEKVCKYCGNLNPKLFQICKHCFSHIY